MNNHQSEAEGIHIPLEEIERIEIFQKIVITFFKRLYPEIHKEWKKIEPEMKIAATKQLPALERFLNGVFDNFSTMYEEFKENDEEVLSILAEEFRTLIESTFKDFQNYLNKSPSTYILLNEFSNSSDEIESHLKKGWLFFESKIEINDILKIDNIIKINEFAEDNANYTEISNYINDRRFIKRLVKNYSSLNLADDRCNLIEEAIELHGLGYYAGSTVLLYTIFEGTVTDILLRQKWVQETKTGKLKSTKKNTPITGLFQKMDILEKEIKENREFFNQFKNKNVHNSPYDATLTQSRNIILHGRDTKFPSKVLSLKLILCLHSVILKLMHIRNGNKESSKNDH
ncbi:hypothetical protein [Alteromonas sp. a30]|uniref:hypothetical protein n=1 Tax=Alteromonas sp. a30 TaxID=2730917 RepID=UPI0022802974|nr:hypothetical protein [Alteromonas sp. a30]MCY7295816.1 hypothetical protein [Alteromonas sp. a30]